jgi:hypothetical protein
VRGLRRLRAQRERLSKKSATVRGFRNHRSESADIATPEAEQSHCGVPREPETGRSRYGDILRRSSGCQINDPHGPTAFLPPAKDMSKIGRHGKAPALNEGRALDPATAFAHWDHRTPSGDQAAKASVAESWVRWRTGVDIRLRVALTRGATLRRD